MNSLDLFIFILSASSQDFNQGIFPHQKSPLLFNGVHQLVVFEISQSFFVG